MSDPKHTAAAGGGSSSATSSSLTAAEEMKLKRREKLRAWQESKAKEKVAKQQVVSQHSQEQDSEAPPRAIAPEAPADDTDQLIAPPVAEVVEEGIAPTRRGWTLEDDDEDEDEEDAADGNEDTAFPPDEEMPPMPSPPKLSRSDGNNETLSGMKRKSLSHTEEVAEVKEAVFSKLTATAVSGLHSSASLRTTTAAELASQLNNKNIAVAAGSTGGGMLRRRNRMRTSKWDTGNSEKVTDGDEEKPATAAAPAVTIAMDTDEAAPSDSNVDSLEAFMSSLYEGGGVVEQKELTNANANMSAGVGNDDKKVITFDEIMASMKPSDPQELDDEANATNDKPKLRPVHGWESDIGGESPDHSGHTPLSAASLSARNFAPTDEEDNGFKLNHFSENKYGDADERADSLYANETEEEREARLDREKQEFIDAIKKAREEEDRMRQRLLDIDEQKEKLATIHSQLDEPAEVVQSAAEPELGRVFAGDGDMVEEYEIEKNRKKSSLEILEEAKRGKMLKEIDHSKVEYLPFRKNLYIIPRALSRLSETDVAEKREDLHIKVRGKGCPVPVDTWEQCGLSDRILQVVRSLNLKEPFPIQKQAIPAIMCGRDAIGVAKTGSGKTLAFLLPMLRHILDQPPLLDGEGPIGLILAPARELAFQIYNQAKKFTKPLGLRCACIYGGAGVAEQIADLKRGSEIVVCTPGRMIDILCMQAGKLVSLKRVTMVVMDEADRMFDMGFEPQIRMIIQNVRPDRQTVLFSATFPKQIEKLAKSVLRLPLEIVVGERSTVNKDITQMIEVRNEGDKFLRLLQLLGIWYERGSVLVFVDKQEKCDQLFQDLLKSGYPSLSLHGGKDQVDRDHTLHEFKTGIKTVMVATSVAGRGLDVPEIVLVVNYNCPNHLEDYVHRVGRTGRAGRKGTAITFVSQKDEQYASLMIRILQKAGRPIPDDLASMANNFKAKVERGEAKWADYSIQKVGKGFKFDASEMNETQKVASMQRKAYAIEQGLITDTAGEDADDEDDAEEDEETSMAVPGESITAGTAVKPVITENMTPLEKAKALAASIAGKPSVDAASSSSSAAATAVNAKAALEKARLIAQQMASGGAGGGLGGTSSDYFFDEIDINDYPPQARRKVTNRSAIEEIVERTGVAIISRGTFIPAGKKPEAGERRLHLLIEGNAEMSVKQARLEIQRLLDEETIRISMSGNLATTGRYSVL